MIFSCGIARRYGFVLCLDTKNQKSSQTEGFFAALGLCPGTARATIVLPVFG
jgi:hypothetical protein